MILPEKPGEIKIVVPEGAGEKGTINPDLGKPIPIGFKGTSKGKFTMRIFTQFGELIYEVTKESDTAEGWFNWLPGDLSSGVYVVHIEGPGVKTFKKLPLLR